MGHLSTRRKRLPAYPQQPFLSRISRPTSDRGRPATPNPLPPRISILARLLEPLRFRDSPRIQATHRLLPPRPRHPPPRPLGNSGPPHRPHTPPRWRAGVLPSSLKNACPQASAPKRPRTRALFTRMSAHESSEPTPNIPLETSADELRRRCEAVARFQGGSTYFHEELGIFRSYAQEKGLDLTCPPPELSRPPDEEGNEHQVWSGPERNVVTSDTHRGNMILMDDGLLAPIDFRVHALSGALLDTVVKLCQSA